MDDLEDIGVLGGYKILLSDDLVEYEIVREKIPFIPRWIYTRKVVKKKAQQTIFVNKLKREIIMSRDMFELMEAKNEIKR